MNIPTTLEEWAYESVVEIAKLGKCEGETHDFKFNLPNADNLTKVCCAFANSRGGFLVIGVKDNSGRFTVEGVDPDGEIAKKFSDKLHTEPSIEFPNPHVINIPEKSKVLYVFHIPQSRQRPHIPQIPDKRLFWKRTPGGCEHMSYNEIQEQFLRYEERREKLKLLFIELLLNQENLQSMSSVANVESQYSLLTLDSDVLDRLLVDTFSVIQGEHQLIKILLTLRTQIRVTNAKTQIFFNEMALPLTNRNESVVVHNKFIKEKSSFLLPLIAEAIEILEKQFGLVNPLPD